MDLIIASNNLHKCTEIKDILKGKFDNIFSLKEYRIIHETIEDGETFFENAKKKAIEICAITGLPTLADDSGLCVNSLNGAPGVFSARYSGALANDRKNNELLLENLKGKTDRSAFFNCTVVLAFPDGKILTAEGRVNGKIIDTYRGENGFGYDPIFEVDGLGKTYAELTNDEKNHISHRAGALKNLLNLL